MAQTARKGLLSVCSGTTSSGICLLGQLPAICNLCTESPQQCALLAELMHAYNVLANRTEVYAGGEGIITLSEPNRMNSAVGEDESRGYEFHDSQTCRDAIEGRFTSANTTASRFLLLHETVVTMQRRHNDLIHEANQVLHRVQQSWHSLAEAYDA